MSEVQDAKVASFIIGVFVGCLVTWGLITCASWHAGSWACLHPSITKKAVLYGMYQGKKVALDKNLPEAESYFLILEARPKLVPPLEVKE